jgi:hypothetical protein
MLHKALFLSIVLLLAGVTLGRSQGIPGCYPQPVPMVNSCAPQRPVSPITRTVQVDVPVPCAPANCGPELRCPPHPCAPLVCVPPQPTRPVQVRVDVVVRPEKPQPCVPQRFCCENPPVFEPFFCKAAGLIQSLIVAPLGIGERFMGHPVPAPLPAATPIPCWSMCAPTKPVCVQPPPTSQCMPPCAPVRFTPNSPVMKCAIPGPPVHKTPPCKPAPVSAFPAYGNFPR